MKQFAYFDAPQRGTLRRVDYVGAQGARKYALVHCYPDVLQYVYNYLPRLFSNKA